MRDVYRVVLILLLGTGLVCVANAQPELPTLPRSHAPPQTIRFDHLKQARFEHFTVADGLPENTVRVMLQDRLGFLWLGTQNGLVRYDGQAVTVFQPDADDPHSIGGTFIRALYEDRAGDLWITSDNGLVHYDRARERFTTYRHDPADSTSLSNNRISQIHEDVKGDLWVVAGDHTLDRFNRATGTFTRFRHDPNDPGSLSHDRVGAAPRLRSFNFSFIEIAALFEDQAGTLWVGTAGGGLNRFDPETEAFTRYQHDPDDPSSLSHDHIMHIEEDRAGHLWVSTYGGINRFDPQTETFTHYQHDPNDVQSVASDTVFATYEDQLGALWITTLRGLDRFDLETGTFTHFPPDPEQASSPSHEVLLPMQEDEAGLWFFNGEDGLDYYDRDTGTFTHLANDPNDDGSLNPSAISLLVDRSGTLWVGTFNNGLDKLDRTVRFPLYAYDPDDPNSLSDNRVRALYEAPLEPGILWIGTVGGGLNRFDLATGRFTHYRHDPRDTRSLSADTVSAIIEDHAQRLWVGTSRGLDLMDRRSGTFTRYTRNPADPNSLIWDGVAAIHETRDSMLWIGTRGGLDRFDVETQTFTHYTATADTSYHPALYRAIAPLATEERRMASILHVGGEEADLAQPFTVEEPTRVFILAMGESTATQSYDYGWLEDEAGRVVWRMTWEESRHAGGGAINRIQAMLLDMEPGRYQLRFQSNTGHGYGAWNDVVPDHPEYWGIQVLDVTATEADTLTTLLKETDENRLSYRQVVVLYEDRDGLLWIGTNGGGLNRLDPATGTFTAYGDLLTGPGAVMSLHEDQAGRLWLADYMHGLHLIDRKTGPVRRYTMADGLPSNSVVGILEDDEGILWISTFNGLSRFDPETETFPDGNLRFRNYDTSHGLQGEQFSFASYHKSVDGTLFFGGPDGFNALEPNRLADDPNPPEVALTGFELFNEAVAVGPASPLKQNITVAEAITLAHDENDFTVRFAALHFSRPEENTMAYKLEPYDEDWVRAGAERQARYTNLSPGRYVFRVKAANADGVWNEQGRSIRIRVLPPWWRTWWAYTLYGLLVMAALAQTYRWQHGRIVRREREAARERELEQAKMIEIAHTALQQSHAHLKTTQAQLIQAEKMASLGQLTAGIAHEIKNPLNFVNNFAEVNEELAQELDEALDADEDKTALKEIIADLMQNAQVIAQHGKRADGIVHAMMQHASGGTGQRESTDINTLVSEHIDLAYHGKRAQVPDLTVEIERDLDEEVGSVEVIPQEIGRVLLNLLGNAFDAVLEKDTGMGRQGDAEREYIPTVTVSTRCVGDSVEIRVQDNGSGIPIHLREKIYEPFFTTKPTGQGSTGLGLSLAYDIVTQGHGGTLTVESEEGQGATFVIILQHETRPTDGNKPTDVVNS